MIASYGETSGFAPVTADEQAAVNGGNIIIMFLWLILSASKSKQ
jgi:hypothetical protein